jgi:glycosyltransferase involved in cell wall biosynthesis
VRKRVSVIFSGDSDHPQIARRAGSYTGAGYDGSFVGMDRFCTKEDFESANGLPCRYLIHGWGTGSSKVIVGLMLWSARLLWHLLRLQTDLIHVHELDSAFVVALVCRFRGIPFIYDVFDNYGLRHHWPTPVRQAIWLMDWFVLSRSSAVILPDENRITGPFARFEKKITVIYLCPPDLPGIERFRVRHKYLTVCAMGNLSETRGISLLLDAARQIGNVRIVVAGNPVQQSIKDKLLSTPGVEFCGQVSWEHSAELAAGCDLIFTFYDPDFECNVRAASQKWFESLMVGRPILCNREIVNAAWIEKFGIGFLSDYSVADLARTLEAIGKDREEAERRGLRGRSLFETTYSWALMEQRLLSVIGEVSGTRFDP